MNIVFDDKVKKALMGLLKDTSANYIRIKPFRGCGKPAYQISISFKGKKDDEEKINDGSLELYIQDRHRVGHFLLMTLAMYKQQNKWLSEIKSK